MKKAVLFFLCVFIVQNVYSQSWQQVGPGINGAVGDLIVYNGKLIIAGSFTSPGNNIAQWDGNSYQQFGQGTDSAVMSLDTLNSHLYIGGSFLSVDQVPANGIAMWNGFSWSPLGGGRSEERRVGEE